MRIVIDNKIPFIRGVLEPFAEVLYLPGGEISREHLMDAVGLIVRTRTHCNQKLLEGTKVKFIGTATIGFDHIDTNWCEKNGIAWTNAPGCNSGGVAQYIAAILLAMSCRSGFGLNDKTLGIIGVGHVGSKVQRIAQAFGMRVLLNDPPRAREEGPEEFTGLENLLAHSDIISIHVPLNREGNDKTWQMVDRNFLDALKPGAILINSSRGEVLKEDAVIAWMKERLPGSVPSLVLDVWPHEPDINLDLLSITSIATPHIAGYSLDGKYNATKMIVSALANEFGLELGGWKGALQSERLIIKKINQSDPLLINYLMATYDILADDQRLRESPGTFEEQRNNYPVRREFSGYTIDPFPEGETGKILAGLGFKKAQD